MPEPNEIGRFGFAIRVLRTPDGKIEYQTGSTNQGVSVEIVIMQMKAFLNNVEKEYFDKFDRSFSNA